MTERSALGLAVSVSVAVSFAAIGSVVSTGGATVAVFVRSPVAEGLVWATTVYVMLPPAGMSTVSSSPPVPLAVKVVPAVPLAVQVADVTWAATRQ